MNFLLLDVYETKVQGKPFDVVVLYEVDSHQIIRTYFPFDADRHSALNDLFVKKAYDLVNEHISYAIKDGKLKLRFNPKMI